jgi:GT2 family glycosyltransferase
LLFSVIIPTCHRNELLGKCLDRLAPGAQTLPAHQYEVIVTDDSTGEGAETFCKQYYPWVRYTRGPRKGPAANRNNGARLAAGDWLVFIDDDCEPNQTILQEYYFKIQSHPEIQVLEGTILPKEPKPEIFSFAPIKDTAGFLWSCNFCIHFKAFRHVGGFDEIFKYPHMEDKDLQVRLENSGYTILFVPQASVIHPWRTLASPRTLAIREESFIYFYKKHKLDFKVLVFARKLFFFYASRVKEQFSFQGLFQAGIRYFVHITVFLAHLPGWKRKYGL